MSEKEKCARCKEDIEHVDNILEYSFWGLVQRRTETTVRKSIRVASTTIRRDDHGMNVMRADEESPLCDPCWGMLVVFLQGREVLAVDHEHDWKQMHKHPILDRCSLCYKTRITQLDAECETEPNRLETKENS